MVVGGEGCLGCGVEMWCGLVSCGGASIGCAACTSNIFVSY
jgi:hypothetical protein